MEGLIALYIAYALWKATVEAVVNMTALLKGKSIVIGDGGGSSTGDADAETYRRYTGRGIGTILGALVWSLVEGAKTGWVLADAKYGPKIKAARQRRRHGGPTVDGPDSDSGAPLACTGCGGPLGDAPIVLTAGGMYHARCAPQPARCARCDAALGDGMRHIPGGGWLCDACGGRRERPPETPPTPDGGGPADLTDADGRPVPAIWEIEPARGWASVHTGRAGGP